ncbi:ribulose bisphosphate carboxylase/oxygenase activase, chloroplastic-like [Curcuma longa]|uniref:ribulose bisphosphate carboxylase/oxygenase activase, chloroplastic-like n=1 Tax=Curcuma longa TaxID=136217 RepID=UPI003D9F899D
MGMEPIIMSAGELESERAGEPGKLIRERYRTASQVIQNQGKMSCLMINDIDAGLGRFGNTQMTVNNQIVVGTLMNLSDNPTRVSIGQKWRESDVTHRVPIIVTGNDFSTLYAPLIRDGRMEKFYWQPDREDIINIVHQMYAKDGISQEEVIRVVDTFPNQGKFGRGAGERKTSPEPANDLKQAARLDVSDSPRSKAEDGCDGERRLNANAHAKAEEEWTHGAVVETGVKGTNAVT